MPNCTVPADELNDGTCTIAGDEARHLAKVLRMRPGERVDLTDGEGRLFEGKIDEVGKNVTVSVVRELTSTPPFPVTLFVSLLKREKMEWIAEKAVELNLSGVTFVKTRHSVPGGVSEVKKDRLDRIIQTATKQCGRAHPLAVAILEMAEAMKKPMTHFICVEREAAPTFGEFFKTYSVNPPYGIWIGPEGGWDEKEKEEALARGFYPISLGPLVLKAETAGIAAASGLIAVAGGGK